MKARRLNIGRKAASIAMAALFGATFLAGSLTLDSDSSVASASSGSSSYSLSYENATGTVDLTDIKVSNLSSSVIKAIESEYGEDTTATAIIRLEGSSVLDGGKESEIEAEQEEFLSALDKSGISYTLKSTYTNIINAVAVEMSLTSFAAVKNISGVYSVSAGSTYSKPETIEVTDGAQTNVSNIYKTGIYNSSEYVDAGIDGRGMTIAILDTGLDYTHEAFDPAQMVQTDASGAFISGADEGYLTQSEVESLMGDGSFNATTRSGATATDVYVNAKVPFAYDYADDDSDVYPSYSQHGTHVAGIIAGKADSYTDEDGNYVYDSNGEKETFRGVAPEAQLVICKVFTDDLDSNDLGSAETEDILDALEDCVKLGVDVINMSLGTTSGFTSSSLGLDENDDEGVLMKEVYSSINEAGISLMVAASNDFSSGYGSDFGTNLATNPDSGTVGSPSTFDGAVSIASVNGQYSPYLIANGTTASDGSVSGGEAIYFEESRNQDSEAYDFLEEMFAVYAEWKGVSVDTVTSATFKYVVVSGTGANSDYSTKIKNELADKSQGPTIAVIKRGTSTFKDKIQIAKEKGADGVIIYNNVSGMIRVSLQDIQESQRLPCISVSMDAGAILTGSGSTKKTTGTITLDNSYEAGPFMNDYSSWGTTADLNIKPDVTAHGGEITSTVAGGYDEMSGTSMATPNLSGFTALLKSYLKNNYSSLWQVTSGENAERLSKQNLTNITNNIIMSTATTVYDQNKLPYSPRKQGSGLATMSNAFSTGAYLYTDPDGEGSQRDDDNGTKYPDGRPKAELGADTDKTGKYSITFYACNFGSSDLTFKTNTILMTETLGADGLSVAEKAHLFDSCGVWKVNGESVGEGSSFTVGKGSTAEIEVTISLSSSEKEYIETNFPNGMFVEGYLQLIGSGSQCTLNLPFLSFYGDWSDQKLLDYDCFEVASFDKNTSYSDEDRPKASVWATQAYSYYSNETYATPLGSFLYVQDEAKEHTSEYIYTEKEHIAISRFNDYTSADSSSNYLTITGIRALYAGLLRNAEIVTYTITNVDTGEIIKADECYRISKAYAGGGSAAPAVVPLELRTSEMGLEGNGKYQIDFYFYFDYKDYDKGNGTDDTFSMTFYVDYEAPILTDSRIRFQDMKDESGNTTQKVYLDLDVYDNHYTQDIILCYGDESDGELKIKLATEYITPVLNAKKNDTTTVSIEITDLYEDYKGNFYVEVDDYAMNHNVYIIDVSSYAEGASVTDDWTLGSKTLTVAKNSTAKISIENIDSANLSNFDYFIGTDNGNKIAEVKNGEVFGIREGTAQLTVSGGGKSETLTLTVTSGSSALKTPSISFSTILNADETPVATSGTVEVNPAQTFKLTPVVTPWYYEYSLDAQTLTYKYTSSNEEYASVDENGNVTVLYEGDEIKSVTITATCDQYPSCSASVMLSIQEPFTVSSGTLTKYRGWGYTSGYASVENLTLGGTKNSDGTITGGTVLSGTSKVLYIPDDKMITTIGAEAFADLDNVEVIVIPKSVTTIKERAFDNCTSLKAICFIDTDKKEVADAGLTLIEEDAFRGCTSLQIVDLSNCKVFTIDKNVFTGCSALTDVLQMTSIGTAGDRAFMNCTSLKSIDITSLHVAGNYLFAGCKNLTEVVTGRNTAMGSYMFSGCTKLSTITINNSSVPAYAFAAGSATDSSGESYTFKACGSLNEVTLNGTAVSIGEHAFDGCSYLEKFTVNGSVSSVGDRAFCNCVSLTKEAIGGMQTAFDGAEVGLSIFSGISVTPERISGTILKTAALTITSEDYLSGLTEVGRYAFSGSSLSGISTLNLPTSLKINVGSFYGLTGLTSITLPAGITEIPAYAFANTGLTSITIPSSVKTIGAYAFAECSSLVSVTFEDGSALTTIGEGAFESAGITSLSLPATVTTIGDSAFRYCKSLTSANVPSATNMGDYAFAECTSLKSATFGDAVTDMGNYTFDMYESYYSASSSSSTIPELGLTSVTLGGGITEIGTGVFMCNNVLESINLNNAVTIGDYAFSGCSALETITGINKAEKIGNYAFSSCTALTSLDLSGAREITYRAFASCNALASVTLGEKLEGIGDEAFTDCDLKTLEIPASCTSVGYSPVSLNTSFASFKVAEGNKYYFSDDGVLYRYIDGEDSRTSATLCELVSYPQNKIVNADEDGNRVFTVREGTLTIKKYAFINVTSSCITQVVLPFTLKTIGTGAFYASTITSYKFESISAPVLLEDYLGKSIENDYSSYSFYYWNFGEDAAYLASVAPHYPGGAYTASTLEISYPENATGYTNFVYEYFFGEHVTLDEYPEDDSRTLKKLIESLPSADTVSGYTTANTATSDVAALSESVKKAHGLYNALSTDVQTAYVGDENITKLFAVESALKSVKSAFGITVSISGVAVDSSSTHKTAYKVGEKFSLDGLKIKVTYDDYSTEIVDADGNFVLSERYDRALRASDTQVYLEGASGTIYEGKTVYGVNITVTEAGADEENSGSGANTIAIVLGVAGGVIVVGAAAAAVVIFLRKRKSASAPMEISDEVIAVVADEDAAENDAATDKGDGKTDD